MIRLLVSSNAFSRETFHSGKDCFVNFGVLGLPENAGKENEGSTLFDLNYIQLTGILGSHVVYVQYVLIERKEQRSAQRIVGHLQKKEMQVVCSCLLSNLRGHVYDIGMLRTDDDDGDEEE